MALIDKFSEFIKSPSLTPKLSREEACSLYRESGGIMKVDRDKLLFPNQDRLVTQLAEITTKRDNLTAQLRFWQRQYRELAPQNVLEDMLRVTDPLFWEHLLKLNTERDYRTSFEKVDLPMKYMREERYRRIIKAFVRDKEYRKKLVKAKTSIISKSSDTIKEGAEKKREFKRRIIEEKLEQLRKDREELMKRMAVLDALLEWSSGGKVEQERPVSNGERDDFEENR